MNILFEDENIIVLIKPAGIATQTANIAGKDMVAMIKRHIYEEKGISNAPVFVIHRLDQPVEGILVFAYDKESAANVNRQIISREMQKTYTAIVEGKIELDGAIELRDYLYKDSKQNKAIVTSSSDKRGKEAILKLKCVGNEVVNEEDVSILEIELCSGRFHQIRAQLSHFGHPILNDEKYGASHKSDSNNIHSIALYANKLKLIHPENKRKMSFDVLLNYAEFLDKYR